MTTLPSDPEPAAAPAAEQPAMSDRVARNVLAVTQIGLEAERGLSAVQRLIERGARMLGRPGALTAIASIVVAWIAINVATALLGRPTLDAPPFFWLQGAIGLAGLLTAMMVLITQSRLAKQAEQHMHLDLQVNLMTEQKVTKLIELIEELRRDLPNVHDRRDVEAELMQRSAEPLDVIAALEEKTLEVVREVLETPPGEGAPPDDPPKA